jgi:signal transduction histidine kinase
MLGLLRRQVGSQAKEHGVRLEIRNETEGVLPNREANIILMVLTNLARNAIQALAEGGEVVVETSSENGDVLFEVADNGPGLPDHIQATLFTPSRSTKARGTGLGLAISKQLANHLGADLILKKTSEHGTTFQLRLPAAAFQSATL